MCLIWRKNKPMFYEKQADVLWKRAVVLWKTSRRFIENKPSFYEKQAVVLWKVEKWMRRHREEVKKKIGGDGIFMGEDGEWIYRVEKCEMMGARSFSCARTYTRIQEFLCFCCHKCHSGSRNRLKYSGICGFVRVCLLLESWNKEKRVENRRWWWVWK